MLPLEKSENTGMHKGEQRRKHPSTVPQPLWQTAAVTTWPCDFPLPTKQLVQQVLVVDFLALRGAYKISERAPRCSVS